jgi:hypothetical protein
MSVVVNPKDISDVLNLLSEQDIIYTNQETGEWSSILPLKFGGRNLANIVGIELLYESHECEAWKLLYNIRDEKHNNVLVVTRK